MLIKIIAWNINGIRSIIDKNNLYDLIKNEKPNIICFGETKLTCPIDNVEKKLKEKKKILINKLILLINSKKLNKKEDINYDSINGKIINIPILKFKNEEYVI